LHGIPLILATVGSKSKSSWTTTAYSEHASAPGGGTVALRKLFCSSAKSSTGTAQAASASSSREEHRIDLLTQRIVKIN
jgi:hypothetical protein